jgi:hypothetical protein
MADLYSRYTQELPRTTRKPQKRERLRKFVPWLTGAAGVLLVCVLLWGLHAHHRRVVVASLGADPRKIAEAARAGTISQQERDAAMQAAFRERRAERMRQRDEELQIYFALPPGAPRQQRLDKAIDQLQARMKEFQAAMRTRPAPPAGNAPPTSNDRLRRRESTPPAQRAQWAQFRADMQSRMQQRGITAPTWGR